MRPVKGFEDYFVTREGCVFSFKRYKTEGMVMRPYPNKKGYHQVCLCKDKKSHLKLIHRLVTEAYLDNTYDYPEVDHIDNDPSNNNLSNLRWVPCWYNTMRQEGRQVREWIDPRNGDLYYCVNFTKPDGKRTDKKFKDKDVAECFLRVIQHWLDNWDGTPQRPDFLNLWQEKISE